MMIESQSDEEQHINPSDESGTGMATGDERLAIHGGRPVRPGGPFPRQPNRPSIQSALEKAYRDGDWRRYDGRQTELLREALAAYHGVLHVELCCSGTAALEIALKGLNVRPGDEVVVSGYDFKGVVASVLAVGAIPVVVDIDVGTLAPSRVILEEAATSKTKAAVVSHLHGQAALIDPIMDWARERGVAVLEDACQSPGAMIAGKRAGTWGDVGVLSFGGSKLLTAGRGGALLTSDARVAQRIRLHCERGNHAFPMSELQAAVLTPQIGDLDAENEGRASAVHWIQKHLSTTSEFTIRTRTDVKAAYYKLGLLVAPGTWSNLPRDVLAVALRAEGVAIDEGFQAVPDLFARSRFRAASTLPASEYCGRRMLVLHHPVLLAGPEEWELVLRAIEKVASAASRGDLDAHPRS